MRIGKGFVFLLVGALLLGAVPVQAQVSDSDFMSIVPATVNIPDAGVNTNFQVVLFLNNKTTAASLTIPLGFGGANANLRIDTTIINGGNKGVTQKALGSNSAWTIVSSLVDNSAKTILLGYVSFGFGLAPSNDSLVAIHFDLDGGGGNATHYIDSTLIAPSNNLRITTPDAVDIAPQWARGTINIGGVGVGDQHVTPFTYGLDQNYPNPFNVETRISFSLARPGKVELKVFNVLGQAVKTLVDREMAADNHSVVWDGTNTQGGTVASGTYFYRLRIGDAFEETRQMVLLK